MCRRADSFFAYGKRCEDYLIKEKMVPKNRVFGVHDHVVAPVAFSGKKSSRKIVFLFLGRLMDIKGILGMIRAFKLMNHSSRAELWIAGDGPLNDEVVREAGDLLGKKIFMYGYVDGAGKAKLLSAAHVMVLPSFIEGWGEVVNEAMFYGQALIVSDQVGGNVLVRGNGFIVRANDEEAIRDKMDFLASHQAKLREMGALSRKIIAGASDYDDIEKAMRSAILRAGGGRK